MIPRSAPSPRRTNAKRLKPVDFCSFRCAACGRVGFSTGCPVCGEVLCVDSGACHPRHQPCEYVAKKPINVRGAIQ